MQTADGDGGQIGGFTNELGKNNYGGHAGIGRSPTDVIRTHGWGGETEAGMEAGMGPAGMGPDLSGNGAGMGPDLD